MSAQSVRSLPEAAGLRIAPSRPWLDQNEAADYLRKSPRWVRRAIAERVLPFHRSGRTVVFHVEDLDAYLRGSRVEAVGR